MIDKKSKHIETLHEIRLRNGYYKQREESDRYECIAMVASSILHGHYSYEKFLSHNPDPEEKQQIDDWLRGNLVDEDKDKIIPGFNDK